MENKQGFSSFLNPNAKIAPTFTFQGVSKHPAPPSFFHEMSVYFTLSGDR
jgi:hypothetical protein